jgi:hypothetical protein
VTIRAQSPQEKTGRMRVRASFCAITSFMKLILLACLIATPDTCQEERVRVSMERIAGHACMVGAPLSSPNGR